MSEPNWTRELGVLTIATPCRARWASMIGSEQKRYCTRCHLNVYNLSAMSTEDARALLQQSEGRLCVRFYARDDGTVLTRDCPVGIAARLRSKMLGVVTASVAMLFALLKVVGLHLPDDAVAAPPRWPAGLTAAVPPPPPQTPKEADESWMAKRRELMPGARERYLEAMGGLRRSPLIGVIRGNSTSK